MGEKRRCRLMGFAVCTFEIPRVEPILTKIIYFVYTECRGFFAPPPPPPLVYRFFEQFGTEFSLPRFPFFSFLISFFDSAVVRG